MTTHTGPNTSRLRLVPTPAAKPDPEHVDLVLRRVREALEEPARDIRISNRGGTLSINIAWE